MAKKSEVTDFLLKEPEIAPVNPEGDNIRGEFMLKIIDEVFSFKDIEVKTDININQIRAISKAKIFAKRFKCTLMSDLCENMMVLSVSKDRKSRKEFTEISKNAQQPLEEENTRNMRKRLLGE